jgi:hypothetical protein
MASESRVRELSIPLESCKNIRLASASAHNQLELIKGMTEHSREVLSQLECYNDCTMRTLDGIGFQLSKSSLAEHSTVLGYAPDECSIETTNI